MNERQKRLYVENLDLADHLACKATCTEAEYDDLLLEAERALADAVMKYNPAKDGNFENYATPIINRALNIKVTSNGNGMFGVFTKQKTTEETIYFSSGEEVLQAELEKLHKKLFR